ncbi:lysine--tRNA ligase, partial [Corynebacterium variabile]|uniref:lysine--tRNA ligase n=1 Tax=Corynebacterium variabile TaxID=1727 RepID=UPI002648CBE0
MTDAKNPSQSQQAAPVADAANDLPEQVQVRLGKRDRLIADGQDPYPVEVPRTHGLAEIVSSYVVLPKDEDEAAAVERVDGVTYLEPGDETDQQVGIAGRVIFVRNTGKLAFARIQDGDGTQLQAMLSLAEVGEGALAEWKAIVDLGDIVFIHGRVVASKRGELSVMADSWSMASKSLRPLPVAHKELSEDTRIRHRYTDLIMREQARTNAMTRIKVMRALRNALERRGFLEVETPMLQTLHGGAAARPFETHSNALDIDLYLRIAPELYLKRCVVGGIDKVFEVNRNFRNEGVDSSHSPEFAMLETYQAYGTYDTGAQLIHDIIQEIAVEVFGSTTVTLVDGTEYDFGGEWRVMEMYPSRTEALGRKFPEQTIVPE